MDILYYIGNGSHHQNRELLYSLRALEKHCKDIGDVWGYPITTDILQTRCKFKGRYIENATPHVTITNVLGNQGV